MNNRAIIISVVVGILLFASGRASAVEEKTTGGMVDETTKMLVISLEKKQSDLMMKRNYKAAKSMCCDDFIYVNSEGLQSLDEFMKWNEELQQGDLTFAVKVDYKILKVLRIAENAILLVYELKTENEVHIEGQHPIIYSSCWVKVGDEWKNKFFYQSHE